MEVLLGRTLADTWEAAKAAELPFRFDLAAWICAEVARALHYAHELTDETGAPFHLVHRDVNPSNIFLTYDGSIKLFDFGLAKALGRKAHTKQGIVKGKVPYLSPEQLLQIPVDRRSDIFSLGTTLWEMTTLSRLFKRDTDLDTILAIRDSLVPDPQNPRRRLPGRALAHRPADAREGARSAAVDGEGARRRAPGVRALRGARRHERVRERPARPALSGRAGEASRVARDDGDVARPREPDDDGAACAHPLRPGAAHRGLGADAAHQARPRKAAPVVVTSSSPPPGSRRGKGAIRAPGRRSPSPTRRACAT